MRWSMILSFLFGVPGFVFQIYGLVQGNPFWAVLGTVLHVIGLSQYISNKGYHALWGIWGVVPVIGFFILLMQWPRLSAAVSKGPGETPSQKTETTADSMTILGGYKLLAALAPFGIVPILLCGYFWGGADSERIPPPSQTDVPGETAKGNEAVNAEEESSDEATTKTPVPWNDRVQEGMTYQEVAKLSGSKGEEVVFTPTKHGIVRWKTPAGADLFVRFRGDRVVSSSNTKAEDDSSANEANANASSALDSKLAPLINSSKEPLSTSNLPDMKSDRLDPEATTSTHTKPHASVRLPSYTHEIIEGPYVIHLRNPNTVAVKAGLRLGDTGKDLTIPPNGSIEVHVPDGHYLVHFVKETSPDRVCSGGSLEVGSNVKTRDLELKLPETPR